MTGTMVSDGFSADDMLTELEEANFNQGAAGIYKKKEISQVWISSDHLRKLLKDKNEQNEIVRRELRTALTFQLSTVVLYSRIGTLFDHLQESQKSRKKVQVTLYVILFPGSAKDNTGLKDLNDKILGQYHYGQFIRLRFDAIETIFQKGNSATSGERKFEVVAQTYKVAYILTYEGTRKEFAERLAELDETLRKILLIILAEAEEDIKNDKSKAAKQQRKEIGILRKKLKKGYRFDIFFGITTLKGIHKSKLENVFLLITEALKAVAIARYVAKINSKKFTRAALKSVNMIKPDPSKLDARGKNYDWSTYMKASDMAEKIKVLFSRGYTKDSPYVLNEVWVDTVWTIAFVKQKNLYWGNPDVVRDVRKKKLESPPFFSGYSFPVQRDLLELWLLSLNLIDFVKRFKSDEFHNKVKEYHDDVSEVFNQLSHYVVQGNIDWRKLEKVMTEDVRKKKIAVSETASEFQFFSSAADHAQRIFFSMDIRDMGVDLMLEYEMSNREIGYHKYRDVHLMEETFRATDTTDERRRITFDQVVEVFKTYYNQLVKNPSVATRAVQKALRVQAMDKLGTFEEAVQIMLGGDEIYVAAHPLFAEYVVAIIAELDKTPYGQDQTLNMRASIAYSSASKVRDPHDPQEREVIHESHDQAMKLAEKAPHTLKRLERTQRRIERLIDMLEANDHKKHKAPDYRKALDKIPLTKLFARVKHGDTRLLSSRDFKMLLGALQVGDIRAAEKTDKFELIDFNGNVVNGKKLEEDAKVLEDKVRLDVGKDNIRFHPPPIYEMPKWIKKLLDWYAEQDPDAPRKSCLSP